MVEYVFGYIVKLSMVTRFILKSRPLRVFMSLRGQVADVSDVKSTCYRRKDGLSDRVKQRS